MLGGAVTEAVSRARTAFQLVDLQGLKERDTEAVEALRCLSELLTPDEIAELHRIHGIRLFADRDPSHGVLAFAAARAIHPKYEFPPEFLAPANPIRKAYDAAEPGEATDVSAPPAGTLFFNGVEALVRPGKQAVVLQQVDDSGVVRATDYLWPADPMPAYVVQPPRTPGVGKATVLGASAGAAALASAGLCLVAGIKHAQYQSPDTPYDELDGLRGSVNTSVVACSFFGAAALGLGTGAVLSAR